MFHNPFKRDTYTASRPKVMSLCRKQYVDYLRRMHPEDSIEQIEKCVDAVMKERLVVPTVDLIRHPSCGNTIREEIPLTQHLANHVRNRIISPSGSVYLLPNEKESFLRITIGTMKAERSRYKHEMLVHKESGDALQASIANYLQSNAKITNNSFAGALNSPYNILYDKPNFAATTSISRQSVKCGYSHIELFLGGNLYLPTYDDIVSYCQKQLEYTNLETARNVLKQFKLHIPTQEEVYQYFLNCIQYYVLVPPREALRNFVNTLSAVERCVVFYNGCMRNLIFFNDAVFRPFFDRLFDVSNVAPKEVDNLKAACKVDPDLWMMVLSLHFSLFGVNEKGDYRNLDSAITENPDGVRQFLGIVDHFAETLNKMRTLFDLFLCPNSDLGKIHDHPAIVRTNTLISDTDSALFTTQNFVEWYCNGLSFDQKAFSINAFAVFSVVKSLEHRFARLSCGFGMVGDDVYGINMKNEYFMAVLIRTSIKKHYVALNVFQEGKILPKPKLDIKGVQFRDSKLSAETNTQVEDFLSQIVKDVQTSGTLKGKDFLRRVKDYELKIFKSLMVGERTYLKTDPIKEASEYNDDPMGTSYFYYDLWDKVFAPELDAILLPNKCYVLPLKNKGAVLYDPEWHEQVRKFNPAIHRKLLAYLEESAKAKRDITRLMLPPSIASIPEIFRPLIDTRSIIFTNCQPLYLALKTLGFAYNFGPNKFLIADYFETEKGYSVPYN